MSHSNPNITDAEFWSAKLTQEIRADGSIVLQHEKAVQIPEITLVDRLKYWVDTTPDAILLSARDANGEWEQLSYKTIYEQSSLLAKRFLEVGLTSQTPIIIISPNSLDNAKVAIAAMLAGIPYAPVSIAYALLSKTHSKLKSINQLLTPGCIYTATGVDYEKAVYQMGFSADLWLVSEKPAASGSTLLSDFIQRNKSPISAEQKQSRREVTVSPDNITPDSIIKYLFTSGSTGTPKAVINTHRMVVSNHEMIRDCYRFIQNKQPVIVDWAPWSHTASGNLVFNLAMYNGGSYYIDAGNPTPAGIETTVKNLTEIAPTWYFTVPVGFTRLLQRFSENAKLRQNFFSQLDMFMYAGAPIDKPTYDGLVDIANSASKRSIPFLSSLGATETGPAAFIGSPEHAGAGNIGIPLAGVKIKLVPMDDGFEARIKSPSLTPGYLANAQKTKEMLDDEGYFIIGDSISPISPNSLKDGFRFNGRLSENFKLTTGTWVIVNAVRLSMIAAFDKLVRDVVLIGEGRPSLSALVFLADGIVDPNDLKTKHSVVLDSNTLGNALTERLQALLNTFASSATGSSNRVTKMVILAQPPDIDKGEMTDKGTINQRAVIRSRVDAVGILDGCDESVFVTKFAEVFKPS